MGRGSFDGKLTFTIIEESSTPSCGFCEHKPHEGVLTPLESVKNATIESEPRQNLPLMNCDKQ